MSGTAPHVDSPVEIAWGLGNLLQSQDDLEDAVMEALEETQATETAAVPEEDRVYIMLQRLCTPNKPIHPPMMKNDFRACNVPADEWCLYHCMTAAKNPVLWSHNHTQPNGWPLDADIAAQDKKNAEAYKKRLLAHYEDAGSMRDVTRLQKKGPEGYPNDADICIRKNGGWSDRII